MPRPSWKGSRSNNCWLVSRTIAAVDEHDGYCCCGCSPSINSARRTTVLAQAGLLLYVGGVALLLVQAGLLLLVIFICRWLVSKPAAAVGKQKYCCCS